jgi:chromosome segregation ATPase
VPRSPSKKAPSRKAKKPVSQVRRRTKLAPSAKTAIAAKKPHRPLRKNVKSSDSEIELLRSRIAKLETSKLRLDEKYSDLRSDHRGLIGQLGDLRNFLDSLRQDNNFRIKDNERRFERLEGLLKEREINNEVKEAEERAREDRNSDGKTDRSSGRLRSILPQAIDSLTPWARSAKGSVESNSR